MPSDKPSRTPHPFDVATVEKLIDLMADHDLSEIDLHDGDSRIRLRKGGKVTVAPVAVTSPAPAIAPVSPPAHAAGSPKTAANNKKQHVIASPTPGTFYAKPSPDDPPFVKVGSKVTPAVLIATKRIMASVAVPGQGFSFSSSCIARIPKGVAAFPKPMRLAEKFRIIAPVAG